MLYSKQELKIVSFPRINRLGIADSREATEFHYRKNRGMTAIFINGILGNPYRHLPVEDQAQAFREYLGRQLDESETVFARHLMQLYNTYHDRGRNVVLVCDCECSPFCIHGNIIRNFVLTKGSEL